MWRRLLTWLQKHATVLSREPQVVRPPQADRKGVIVGFRWWF